MTKFESEFSVKITFGSVSSLSLPLKMRSSAVTTFERVCSVEMTLKRGSAL